MKGPDTHSTNLLAPAFEFLKVVGASLTGLTALLTAAGFLAERARLSMLGLPSVTFDLEQYVETGARLVALMPVLLALAVLFLVLSWLAFVPGKMAATLAMLPPSAWLALLLVASGALVGYLRWRHTRQPARSEPPTEKPAPAQSGPPRARGAPRRLAGTYGFQTLLVAALLLQFICLERQVSVLEQRDVLFKSAFVSSTIAPAGQDAAQYTPVSTGARERDGIKFFGITFLIVVLNASVLLYVVRKRLPRIRTKRWKARLLTLWCVLTALMVVSQVTFVPVTYGTLLSATNFPEVCADFSRDPTAWPDPPPPTRLVLVHESGDGVYLYSRSDRKMWYVLRQDVAAMVHYAQVDVLDPAPAVPCPRGPGS